MGLHTTPELIATYAEDATGSALIVRTTTPEGRAFMREIFAERVAEHDARRAMIERGRQPITAEDVASIQAAMPWLYGKGAR